MGNTGDGCRGGSLPEWHPAPQLLRLLVANAWAHGPMATAMRVLDATIDNRLDPETFWPALTDSTVAMTPLSWWQNRRRTQGEPLATVRSDCLRRERLMVANLGRRLEGCQRLLVVGHDRSIDGLMELRPHHSFRYLLFDEDGPGTHTKGIAHRHPFRLMRPFALGGLAEALDWADAVVLAGFIVDGAALRGPSVLHTLLAASSELQKTVLIPTPEECRVSGLQPRCGQWVCRAKLPELIVDSRLLASAPPLPAAAHGT